MSDINARAILSVKIFTLSILNKYLDLIPTGLDISLTKYVNVTVYARNDDTT